MSKRNKIIYWVSTVWLALGMLSTGIVQLVNIDEDVEKLTALGYPVYLLTILGVWKILGVLVVIMPNMKLAKEWAYAGFFFAMSGAIISHLYVGNAIDVFPALLLLVLTVVSWYFRPINRKLISNRL